MANKNKKAKVSKQKSEPQKEAFLDEFSAEDIELWTKNSVSAARCATSLHFDLEQQRVSHHHELCDALQSVDATSVLIDHWVRVTDFQWSLQPLSTAGSIRGIGARFNYGRELSVMRRREFPCLYIASDEYTAKCERFGGLPEEKEHGLNRQQYALRQAGSFSTFDLRGCVNQVFDLRNKANLAPFAEVISKFSVSRGTKETYKKLNYKIPTLIRSTDNLMKRLLARPEAWRQAPNAFGVPASSQIFGWFLREAGFEGVLYPSQQGGDFCLAVFPENFKSSDSYIEVTGPYPPGASCTRLDRNNLCLPPR